MDAGSGNEGADSAPQPWIHIMHGHFLKAVHVAAHAVNDIHPETGEHDPGLITKLEEVGLIFAGVIMVVYGFGVYTSYRARHEKRE